MSANLYLMEDFDDITEKIHLPENGEIIYHASKDYGVGTVKDNNGRDNILVEFSTTDKPDYIRQWFKITNLKYELDKDKEKER